MKTSSTLLIVGIVVLFLYLWIQTNKAATTSATKPAAKPATTDPVTAALLKFLTAPQQLQKTGGSGPAAPSGSGGPSNGQGTAAGKNNSTVSPNGVQVSPDGTIIQNPDGSITDTSSGLTYNKDGTVQADSATLPYGQDAQGNTVYMGSDGQLINTQGSIVAASDVTPYETGAGVTTGPALDPGVTTGPQQDTSSLDTSSADLSAGYDESDWG